jgi:hypothetical protein
VITAELGTPAYLLSIGNQHPRGGGRCGIRTRGTLAGPPPFQDGAFDHSANLPVPHGYDISPTRPAVLSGFSLSRCGLLFLLAVGSGEIRFFAVFAKKYWRPVPELNQDA